MVRALAADADPDTTNVGAIISARHRTPDDATDEINAGIATLAEDTPIDEAIRYMDDKQVRRITVHDKEYRIIGVVSRADLPESAAAIQSTA